MTKHRDLDYGDRLPESFLDAVAEELGSYASPNFRITLANSTTVQVVASTGNDQVTLAIEGRWRYNTSTVQAAHPGGTAGAYDVFVTASDNAFVPGTPETDNTVYTFGLSVKAQGQVPSTALYRKVGTVAWSGSAITAINPNFGDLGSAVVTGPDSNLRNRITTSGTVTTLVSAKRSAEGNERIALTEAGLTAGPGSTAADATFERQAGPKWHSNATIDAPAYEVEGVPLEDTLGSISEGFGKLLAHVMVEGVLADPSPITSGGQTTNPQTALQVGTPSGWVLPVAAGHALVQEDVSPNRLLLHSGSGSCTMGTHQPAGGMKRIDAILLRYSSEAFSYEQQVGTARADANLTNLYGAPGKTYGPALTDTALVLAYVLVNDTDTGGPQAGNVLDYRALAGPAIWGEDGHRYRLGVNGSGELGLAHVY